jgi:SAM-dependent methyltransferase/uncharacterized protein YbaR (Trm112 family)
MLTQLLDDGVLTCPACRAPTDDGLRNTPLVLEETFGADHRGQPQQGLLRCPHCGIGYPVIDGIACIFTNVASWLRQEERAVLGRSDLHPTLSTWLASAWGESEDPGWRRQLLAVYGRQLPGVAGGGPIRDIVDRYREDGRKQLMEAGGRFFQQVPSDGFVLDAGCGVGVATLAAARMGLRMVGLDRDFTTLRLLARLLRDGRADVPVWRAGGADFTTATTELDDPSLFDRIALVAGDVLDPPFAAASFGGVWAMNLIDNVTEPVTAIRQLHGITRPGGRWLLSSPFDWSDRATPREHRLGDGVRHKPDVTDPAAVLHALLEGRAPDHAPEVALDIEATADVPWILVRHDRSAHLYLTHLVEAVRPVG